MSNYVFPPVCEDCKSNEGFEANLILTGLARCKACGAIEEALNIENCEDDEV